ncbi:hypothetical protein AQJ58_11800 [Streptomyces sp. DSM 15324]|nr:hypothetical protein AQJ58_11800 [Streptomyces sp. DSM 15324]
MSDRRRAGDHLPARTVGTVAEAEAGRLDSAAGRAREALAAMRASARRPRGSNSTRTHVR